MDYMILVAKEMNGDIISLINVAEAMAIKAASGYGKLQLHEPTLENSCWYALKITQKT
jgi:hypothetical protein